MSSSSSSSPKRGDLQGVRGVAILSVLAFHFFPHLFPNGFLGVDQFFVLSGFLMCLLLSRSASLDVVPLLRQFYTKRFRRILPLFYLVVLLEMIELNTVYPPFLVTNNESSAARAIIFRSNRETTQEENYFRMLSHGSDLFLHTWSLSVEIQFYFLVPFVFVLGEQLPPLLKYFYYSILAATSLALHFTSSEAYSFNSVFARIWQFVIGMVVSLVTDRLEESEREYQLLEDEATEDVHLNPEASSTTTSTSFVKFVCLAATTLLAFWPESLGSPALRPIFTVLTGLLMASSRDDLILENRLLTYIGDISYALYLVHWPVYEFLKVTDRHHATEWLIIGLLGSFLLAAFIHETFEKWYLSLSNLTISLLCFGLLTSIVTLINIDEIGDRLFPMSRNSSRLDGLGGNLTLEDAEKFNNYWNRQDLQLVWEEGGVSRTAVNERWCDYKTSGGGPFKIAVFGNSYARNHQKLILEECSHVAYNITMDAERGCEPLAPSPEMCQATSAGDFARYLESARPDYAFLLTRYFRTGVPFDSTPWDVRNDTVFEQMRRRLAEFLPNIKRKLFILDAIPRIDTRRIPRIVKDLKAGKTAEEINTRLIQTNDGFDRARFRHAALVRECGRKCELIDYLPVFSDAKTKQFRFFDATGFSYFTMQLHISPHGIELVRPVFRKICDNLE